MEYGQWTRYVTGFGYLFCARGVRRALPILFSFVIMRRPFHKIFLCGLVLQTDEMNRMQAKLVNILEITAFTSGKF